MTRNVKRFLAGSLLSFVPSFALASPLTAADFPNLLSERTDYVSLRVESVDVPVRKGPSTALVMRALQDHYVFNQTGATTYLGILILDDTFDTMHLPYPLPTGNYGGYRVSAPPPAPGTPVIQQYYWTDNPSAPASGRTCLYEVAVSNVGGTCSAQVAFLSYNGAFCTLDAAQSWIHPTTCEALIVWGHQ
ncbi:hypothetical protein A176_002789 [Myxococcus hansupus]|uniref:Lipoprotein n=1 Tax=Pseudomyxococcus hansupus TaxID=1297742 RepID=A0A0H4XCZ5_9BACT|nr:hypothetical protein [Myxococcus hansupus]AKQ65877.1 hypothetical protein A176_002789 [Myxococcus hansupus]